MAILMVCAATWSMCEPKFAVTELQCETILTIPSPGKMYCVLESGRLRWRDEDNADTKPAAAANEAVPRM